MTEPRADEAVVGHDIGDNDFDMRDMMNRVAPRAGRKGKARELRVDFLDLQDTPPGWGWGV
jgi:hypothetical protein